MAQDSYGTWLLGVHKIHGLAPTHSSWTPRVSPGEDRPAAVAVHLDHEADQLLHGLPLLLA